MATRARVTLTCLTGDLLPAERVLTLDIDEPSIQIGRASKTLSKGLQAARENAWFDSPVMSRDHAELSYDTDTSILYISDIGSMHGTILNGFPLLPNVPTELNDGDRIIVGAEVRRGPETFPACAFRVNYELTKYRPSNRYCFPESSDMEDEGIFDFSDMEEEDEGVSNDGTSVASSRPKVSESVNMIDLTGDDSFDKSSSRSIDLTHVSESKFDTEVVMTSTSLEHINANKDRDETESIDDAVSQHSSADNESVVADSDHLSDEGTDEEEEEEISDDEEAAAAGLVDETSIADSESIAESEYAAGSLGATEIPSSMIYDLTFQDEASNSSSVDGEGDEYDNSAPLPSIKDHLETLASFEVPESCLSPEIASVIGYGGDQQTMSAHANSLTLPIPITDSIINSMNTPFHHRASSPSDFVTAYPTQRGTVPSTKWPFFDNPNKPLGNGSGKEDYFKAREENKAVLKKNESQAQQTRNTSSDGQQAAPVASRRILKLRLKAPCNKSIQATEQDFSRSSDRSSEIVSTESLEVPATSTASELSPLVDSHRPSLSINDIINRTTPEVAAPAPKRKIDEISTTLEEEVRAWASNSSSVAAALTADEIAPVVAVLNSANLHSQILVERPRKRLRKVMEKMGYAALGGVAVGAALFGSLVATAPDFV